MLHTFVATQIWQCVAKPGFCVTNSDAIPGTLCLDVKAKLLAVDFLVLQQCEVLDLDG